MSLAVVAWLWQEPGRVFLPEHVNVLGRMLRRHLAVPHRLVCISDSGVGLDSGVEWLPTPPEAAHAGRIRSPEGPRFPSCYRRLWAFSGAARVLGDRLLVLDVDLVVTGALAHLLDRPEDFVGWRPRMGWGGQERLAGGMYLLRAGSRTDVWEEFTGQMSVLLARRAGYRGSDQAWISYKLGRGAALWPEGSGLYSIRDMQNGRLPLPADARLVQFNGPVKPWQSQLAWVREHWQ